MGTERQLKKKRHTAEFRFYSIPEDGVHFALIGEKWRQHYGEGIDYLHFHNYMEIGYCYEGKGSLVLGEAEYRFGGGEFTVIPANYLHTTNSDPGNISRWEYLFVDVEGLLERIYPNKKVQALRLLRLINSRAIIEKCERDRECADLIRNILEVTRNSREFYREEAEGYLLSLLVRVARNNMSQEDAGEKTPVGVRKLNRIVSRALDYISDHYGEQLKVKDIAEELHISETHFRRVFTSSMDMCPLEYLNLVRIQSACEYLKKTDESIAYIATKCGFPSSSTFNRNFKQVTGEAPAQWRKRPENYERQLLRFNVHSEEGW